MNFKDGLNVFYTCYESISQRAKVDLNKVCINYNA